MPVRPSRNGDDQLGRLVKRYLTARLLTQRQLAAAAGIALGTLRDLEQGRHAGARWQTVESVAAALDVNQRQRAALIQACRAGRPARGAGRDGAQLRRLRGTSQHRDARATDRPARP